MGTPIEVDPSTALLLCVQVAAGHVEYATRQVSRVPEGDAFVDTNAGRQLHPWARVQQEAMDRLARYSKLAVECGAKEGEIRLAERWGEELARVISAVLDDVGLTDDQRARVPELLRSHLLGLERSYATEFATSNERN